MISMAPITICFTYFRSLALVNLQAALYSVAQQDMSQVEAIVIVDNNTEDAIEDIQSAIDAANFSVPVNLISVKHGDPSYTHSWSTNVAVRATYTPWILFTRADYLLTFDALRQMRAVVETKEPLWNGFITGNVYHLHVDIGVCEASSWRVTGPLILRDLPGSEESYTVIDTGVWMARRSAFNLVNGMNEKLTAWGHAQTLFQYELHTIGTEFVRIPEVLFYHPQHSAPRDITLAHQQLEDLGVDLWDLWERHEGAQPYGRAL